MTTLEKIKTEIEQIKPYELPCDKRTPEHIRDMALDIIDKYAEQEPTTRKLTTDEKAKLICDRTCGEHKDKCFDREFCLSRFTFEVAKQEPRTRCRMKNENAVKQLKMLKEHLKNDMYADDVNALNAAIKALEQEPTVCDTNAIKADLAEEVSNHADEWQYVAGLMNAKDIFEKHMKGGSE